jgi:hypothetical protein
VIKVFFLKPERTIVPRKKSNNEMKREQIKTGKNMKEKGTKGAKRIRRKN